jgi:hypothetical protein
MADGWIEELREVGRVLKLDGGLTVWRGGVVRPSDPPSTRLNLGAEKHHGNEQRQHHEARPATRSREGTAGWERTSGRPGPSCAPAPLLLGDLAAEYERQFAALGEFYPEASIAAVAGGYWLRAESALLSGYGGRALFCVSFPYSGNLPRSWAFLRPPAGQFSWLGPRHTNYPDGSVCAFHIGDQTWRPGDDFVTLLDLYSVWAVRHLHLMTLGTWPGAQHVLNRYERMLESRDDDCCGCGSGTRYVECCKARDSSKNLVPLATRMALLDRRPPRAVSNWVANGGEPPSLD